MGLDVAAAFDTLEWTAILELFRRRPVSKVVEAAILQSLMGQRLTTTIYGHTAASITHPTRGVRQGAPESSILFSAVIDMVLEDVRDELTIGLDTTMFFVGEPSFPHTTAWVDDIYLLSGTHAGMQDLASVTNNQLSSRGLRISPGKCKLIINNSASTAPVKLQGKDVHPVSPQDPVRVLGVWMSGSQGTDAHRPISMGRAWGAFASFRHVFTCHKTSLEARARLLNAKVGSVLLWAAATWRPSKQAVEAVCGIQARMLAAMLRVPRQHNEPWLDSHRRRLRAAWHLMSRAEMSPQNPYQPWHITWFMRRHGWLGHASRMLTDAAQALRWRDCSWWRLQQGLPVTGVRHPARFHPRRFDSDVAKFWSTLPQRIRGGAGDVHELAQDRRLWRSAAAHFVRAQPTDPRLCTYADVQFFDV